MTIADRLARLLSTGIVADGDNSTGKEAADVLAAVQRLEADAASSAKALATINKRRTWDRLRKTRNDNSTGKQNPHISSSLSIDSYFKIKKERKRPPMNEFSGDLFGTVPQPPDDWPQDFAEQFWAKWPPHFRKHSFKQVVAKLARIRKQREATWAQIWAGLCAFVDSKPEHKFIPAPLVWINQQRWIADYSKVDQPKPRKTFGDVMMGRG